MPCEPRAVRDRRRRVDGARPPRPAEPDLADAPCEALLIVTASDTYISPAWYASKAEHGKVVPTWNYEVVHIHGRLVAHDDAGWVAQQIRDLTTLNEADRSNPWAVEDAPAEYIEAMQRGIVGIELVVDALAGDTQAEPEPVRRRSRGCDRGPRHQRSPGRGRGSSGNGRPVVWRPLSGQSGPADVVQWQNISFPS